MELVTSIPGPISRDLSEINIISLIFTRCFSIACEGNAYDLRCCWLQQPKRRRSRYIAPRDSIVRGRSSGSKEAKEEVVRFCQTEESEVAAIEALGDMLRALQTRGF